MADLENFNPQERLDEVPENMGFPETNDVLDDPEIEEAREIIEKLEEGNVETVEDEIKKLTPELAERLVTLANTDGGGRSALYLDGLREISEGVAEKLAAFGGNLYLNGLTEISEGVAEKLAAYGGQELSLNGLTEISEGVAEKLAAYGGDVLSLDGLTEISEGVAEKLASSNVYFLSLNGLTGIKKGVAKLIELYKGTLFFNGIKGISDNINDDIVAEIGKGGGKVYFIGITKLNEGLAKVIGSFNGGLYLDGIKSIDGDLSDGIVAAMSTCPGAICMDNIEEMNMSLSKIISKFQGRLYLRGIKKGISDEEMANIVKCPGYFCLGVTAIDKEFGKKIAGFEGKGLSLPKVISIDDETAEVLIPIKNKFIDSKDIVDAITRAEKKIKRAKQSNQDLEQMRQEIKDTKSKENWDGKRGDKIEYNRKEGEIKSWYNGTKVEEISEDSIKLEGLDLELTKKEGMWLANFKNMIKHEYKGMEVKYTRGVVNKSFAYRKTLYVGNTMLMSRKNLIKRIPSCEDDEVVKKIKDWLNQ